MTNLKKTLIAGFVLAVASCPQAWAESGTCGENCTWTFSNGVLDISGSGPMDDFNNNTYNWGAPWRSLNITSVNIGSQITSISSNAFGSQNLTSVNFANDSNLQSIGDWAFSYTGLTSIDIPDSVTEIGYAAFTYNDNLSAINFGTNSQLKKIDLFSVPFDMDIILPPSVEQVDYLYGRVVDITGDNIITEADICYGD